jgi:hypothetical protein
LEAVMIYDIVSIDGECLGNYEGPLWPRGQAEPTIWAWISQMEYFRSIPKVILGSYAWALRDFTVDERTVEGLEVFYDSGHQRFTVATVVPRGGQMGTADGCPRCRVPGVFVKTALVCPQCKSLLGGF